MTAASTRGEPTGPTHSARSSIVNGGWPPAASGNARKGVDRSVPRTRPATCGSGAARSGATTRRSPGLTIVNLMTCQTRRRACCAAAPGATSPGTCAVPPASGTGPGTGAGASAFGWWCVPPAGHIDHWAVVLCGMLGAKRRSPDLPFCRKGDNCHASPHGGPSSRVERQGAPGWQLP